MSENSPADYVRLVADALLDGTPSPRERAAAELLQCVADSWGQQPGTMRKQAVATARAFSGMPAGRAHFEPDERSPHMPAGYTDPDTLPMAPGCEHWRREHRDDLCPMSTCRRCQYLKRI